ncbi:hypothetical protein AVEN_244670-1 [Araneus ventricosus]|uniref:Uncharacterized protein n=1 Tax=Araneus ventricosus TaxID=182803 RepID=A0A4Y2KHY8_ARAVE|nr:hypothetical protein AVEN_244670-1 [Araneus ventricosus]
MPDPSPSEGDSSSKDNDVSNNGIMCTKKIRPIHSLRLEPTPDPNPRFATDHVVLLRPKKESSSEENRKLVENTLTSRNSAAKINRISKVSKAGLIIEATSLADLEAFQAEIMALVFPLWEITSRSPDLRGVDRKLLFSESRMISTKTDYSKASWLRIIFCATQRINLFSR